MTDPLKTHMSIFLIQEIYRKISAWQETQKV